MLSRIERAAGTVIDTVFGRRWIALAVIVGLILLRLLASEFWQTVLWWTYSAAAFCLFVYLIVLLRREGSDEHRPVEKPK